MVKEGINESLGITYEIEQTQYVEGIEHLEVIFKGKRATFDENKDYGADLLGHPLWNGSIFIFVDSTDGFVWDQLAQKWNPLTSQSSSNIVDKALKRSK